jgi:tyrosinase
MQGRKESDPTSWKFQAAIHGTPVTPPPPGQAQCQHATWYFVAWHRMYVYYFERIVRAAVVENGGREDWALPYWNYELLGHENAKLPVRFRQPTAGNPLYVPDRDPAINAGAPLPPQVTTSRFAESRPLYVGAEEFGGGVTPPHWRIFSGPTGRLEQTPHNDVHNTIGGGMADPDTAALDPIFWLHHGQIDRLWVAWIANGHQNPNDPRWLNQRFSFFDFDGQQVSKTIAEVLDTVADLSYTYDQFAAAPVAALTPPAAAVSAPTPPPSPELVGTVTGGAQLSGKGEQITVPLDKTARSDALEALSTSAPRILLQIHEIEAEETPRTVYGVYVNLPPEATPEQEHAHHVGNLSFFGIKRAREPSGDEPAHGLSLTFDITDLARVERAAGQWTDEAIDVAFLPLRPDTSQISPEEMPSELPEEVVANIGGISVFYAR